MAVKLSDIINLIGAPGYKERLFSERPELTVPEVPVDTSRFTPIRPKNIYELASQIGVESGSGIEFPGEAPLYDSKKESVLQKILEYTSKYPITQSQAKAMYELFTAKPEVIGYVEKVKKTLFGKKKKKVPITISPGPEAIKEELPKIIEPPELVSSIQRLLGTYAKEAQTKPITERGEIKIEELRYPEPVYLMGLRGESPKERAIKEAQEYNENIRALYRSAQEFINYLTSPDLSKILAETLIAPLSLDIAKDIYNMTGGMIDISQFSSRMAEAVSQSREFLESSSKVLSDLFDIKVDLFSELNKILEG